MEHEAALQELAQIDDYGNRLSGTPGYDASAEYVAEHAAAAGLEVMFQDFEYDYFLGDIKAPVLSRGATSFNPGIIGGSVAPFADFGTMFGSADRRRHAHPVGGRPQAALDRRLDERLRGGRLRGHARGRHRADPARHLRLRRQAGERRRRGRGRRGPLQRGQRARTAWSASSSLAAPFDNGPAVGASFQVGQALAGTTTSGSLGTTRLRAGWYAGPPLVDDAT